ncbi:hypothetical protein TSEDIMI_10008 [Tenacibaculum sediminilitoris]|uniref:hypothetical protein n=1 Tax=Tenacibaculum sediminilitoris TaxID=1820334 RepID=UPI0038934BCA
MKNESFSWNNYWLFTYNSAIQESLHGVGDALSMAGQELLVQGVAYLAFRGVGRILPKPVFTSASKNKLVKVVLGDYHTVGIPLKPLKKGQGIPSSTYNYVTREGKALEKLYYNETGELIYEINYKHHNMGGVHGHKISTPGNVASGHLPENHVPFMLMPWDYLK